MARRASSVRDGRAREVGIEANRKGDATLVFRDAQGHPCEANGIEAKAHCLNYVEVGLFPTWVKGDVKREKELAPSCGREPS